MMLRATKGISKNNDFMVALLFLVIGAALLQQALLITVEQSRIFPYAAIGIILISGIALLFRSFSHKPEQDSTNVFKFSKKELVILALMIITYFATSLIGFFISIYLFLIVSYLYIEGTWSRSAFKTSLLFNTVLIIILYVCFSVFLGMVTPNGLLI